MNTGVTKMLIAGSLVFLVGFLIGYLLPSASGRTAVSSVPRCVPERYVIADMEVGEVLYTVPWAFRAKDAIGSQLLFVRGNYHGLKEACGTAQVKIKRADNNIIELLSPISSIDISGGDAPLHMDWDWMQVRPNGFIKRALDNLQVTQE